MIPLFRPIYTLQTFSFSHQIKFRLHTLLTLEVPDQSKKSSINIICVVVRILSVVVNRWL